MLLLSYFLLVAFLAQSAAGTAPLCPQEHFETLVPSGEFIFGSTEEEREYAYALDEEVTRRYGWYERETRGKGTIGSYCIDRFPVTQRQYQRFLDDTGHRAPYISAADYQQQGFLVHPYAKVKPYLWEGRRFPPHFKDHPVVLVSRDDAETYCRWEGRTGKAVYRLPTEWEWEKAARGPKGRVFPWGDQWNPAYLNSGERFGSTTPVGKFPKGASPYGILDMAGNTFEWTSTPWSPQPSADGTQKYVLKGCSWDDLPGTCRAAMRHGRPETSRHILIGFRCVSDLP